MSTDISKFSEERQKHLDAIAAAETEVRKVANRLRVISPGGRFIGPDGESISLSEGSEELTERVRELTEELRQKETQAALVAKAADKAAKAAIRDAENATTVDLPNTSDWERAGAMRATLAPGFAVADLPKLVNELNGALISKDPAKIYVVASLVLERIPHLHGSVNRGASDKRFVHVEDEGTRRVVSQIESMARGAIRLLQPNYLKTLKGDAEELVTRASSLQSEVHRLRLDRGEDINGHPLATRNMRRGGPFVKISIPTDQRSHERFAREYKSYQKAKDMNHGS